MRKGREPQPQLVGSQPVGAGAIGKEIHLLLFDAVFHVATGAIKLLVQCGWFEASRLDRITPSVLGQVGHDKARIYRPWVKSRLFQFPITRRALVQLLRVEYSNSVKLRQGVSTFA